MMMDNDTFQVVLDEHREHDLHVSIHGDLWCTRCETVLWPPVQEFELIVRRTTYADMTIRRIVARDRQEAENIAIARAKERFVTNTAETDFVIIN